MASLKYNLVHALLKGRVYHFPTTHYANPVRCASQNFDCYFASPTNCTYDGGGRPAANARAVHRAVESAPLLWCFELPRRRLSRLAGLQAVHAEAWYGGQLAAFLFRPNTDLVAFRQELLPAFAYDANHTRAATFSAMPGGLHSANGSCAAMHVRRTDKFKGKRVEDRKAKVGFAGFGFAFKYWAQWLSSRPAGQVRVLLGSEDPATFKAMPPLLSPTVSYWVPSRYFVMDSFKDITDNNNKLVDKYARLLRRMAEARAEGAAAVAALEAAGARKDEGMALVMQILLMSECEAFFGSFASNVAILVHDLMHARMVARKERLHAVDVNGRTYCGCGASFCMKVEKRSGREPRRTVRNMVEAFRGSNINAI